MTNNSLFIVSQHRTGSTLLKNILDKHSSVSMAFDEMNLFEPFRKNTLDRLLANGDTDAESFISLIKKKKIYGTFWTEFERSGISFTKLRKGLEPHHALTPGNVLMEILILLKKKNNAQISGVKYPLHVSKIDYLINNFPSSVILFLTRNPKAIIASKLNDPATKKRKNKSFLHRILIHYFTLIYFSLEYVISVNKYMKHKNRVVLLTYEQMVKNLRNETERICNILAIPFEENMLSATGKTSSYSGNQPEDVYVESLNKYNKVLNRFDSKLIDAITKKHYKKVQNESDINI